MVLGYYTAGLDDRSYVQVKLIDSLKKNHSYYVEYFVNLLNSAKYNCNNIGLLFTKTSIYVDTLNDPSGVINANPQILNYGNPVFGDTINWSKVSGIYTAQGGEQYITLGNFKRDIQTNTRIAYPNNNTDGAGYYLDDVSVIPLDSMCLKADAGRDTTINAGDSVFIGSLTNGLDSVKWYANGTSLIDSIRPGFWYTPNTTGTNFFVLQQTVNGCFSSDTIYINVVLPLTMVNYKLLMNNDKQVLNKWETANEINVSHFNIQRSTNGKDFITIHKEQAKNKTYNEYSFIDNSPLSTVDSRPSTYYYRIVSFDKDGKTNYSEVKTINFQHQTSNFAIFPNPAKDAVTINSKGIKHLTITDCFGRIIQQLNNITEHQTINTKQWSNGIYIFSFENGERVKVIKE